MTTQKKSPSKNKTPEALSLRGRLPWLYLAPAAAGFALFYILPFIYSAFYLFFEPDGAGGFVFVNPVAGTLSSAAFLLALKNTFVVFIIYIPAVVAVSVAAAYFIFSLGRKFRRAGRLMLDAVFIPYIVPSCVAVTFWFYIFDARGLMNRIISMVTSSAGTDWKSGAGVFTAMFLLFLWKYSGLNIVIMTAAFSYVPAENIDSGRIDGASEFTMFAKIIMPQIKKQLFFVILLSTVGVFSFSNEIYAVFGMYPPQILYTLQNFISNTFMKMDYYKSVSASVLFSVFVAICAYFYVRAERKWDGEN